MKTLTPDINNDITQPLPCRIHYLPNMANNTPSLQCEVIVNPSDIANGSPNLHYIDYTIHKIWSTILLASTTWIVLKSFQPDMIHGKTRHLLCRPQCLLDMVYGMPNLHCMEYILRSYIS